MKRYHLIGYRPHQTGQYLGRYRSLASAQRDAAKAANYYLVVITDYIRTYPPA